MPRLWGDVDGDESSTLNSIHGVATWLKDVVVNVGLGLEQHDSAVKGGLGGAHKGLGAHKLEGLLQAKLREAELQVVGGAGRRSGGPRVDVDVPLEALERLSEDVRLAAGVVKVLGKLLVKELNLVVKGGMRKVLQGGKGMRRQVMNRAASSCN